MWLGVTSVGRVPTGAQVVRAQGAQLCREGS